MPDLIYLDSYFELEVPQEKNNNINFNNEQLNPQKRKGSFSREAHNVEVGSSSAANDPSTPPPSKKNKLIFDLNELDKIWGITIDKVIEIMIKNNVDKKKKLEKENVYLPNLLNPLLPLKKVLMFKALMIKSRKFSSSIIVRKSNTGFQTKTIGSIERSLEISDSKNKE